jgi:hypothetical protein
MRKISCWLALSLLFLPLVASAASLPSSVAPPAISSQNAVPAADVEALFPATPQASTTSPLAPSPAFFGYGVCSLKCNFNCLLGVPSSCPKAFGFCVPRCTG